MLKAKYENTQYGAVAAAIDDMECYDTVGEVQHEGDLWRVVFEHAGSCRVFCGEWDGTLKPARTEWL